MTQTHSPHLSKLLWQCRRGLLELDVLLEKFLLQQYSTLSILDQAQFETLLQSTDQALLMWFTGQHPLPNEFARMLCKISPVLYETYTTTYIGLGSNLEEPEIQIEMAITALSHLPQSYIEASSHLYLTAPVGLKDQPDFLNAVVCLRTQLSPIDLLDALMKIEQQQLRVRTGEKNAPRTLDLDILLYGDAQIQTTELTIPHPGLTMRAFVLFPLLEIAPDLILPGQIALKNCLNGEIREQRCSKLQRPLKNSIF